MNKSLKKPTHTGTRPAEAPVRTDLRRGKGPPATLKLQPPEGLGSWYLHSSLRTPDLCPLQGWEGEGGIRAEATQRSRDTHQRPCAVLPPWAWGGHPGPVWAGMAPQTQDLTLVPILVCPHSQSTSPRASGSGICKSRGLSSPISEQGLGNWVRRSGGTA